MEHETLNPLGNIHQIAIFTFDWTGIVQTYSDSMTNLL